MKTIKKKTDNNKPILFREFAGLKELTSYLETTPPDAGWMNHASADYPYDKKWSGASSYEQAKEALSHGSNIREIKNAISRGAGATSKRTRTLNAIGAIPNVPAYLAGNPACMYRSDKAHARGAYNVFVDTGVSCGVNKSAVMDAGIDILIRVLRLASKYPVNLYVGDLGTYDDRIYGFAVKIMDAGKAYNTARVSYALTEVGFLRVFGLAVIERNGQFWNKSASMTYGRPLRANDRKDVVSTVFKNAIVLSTDEVVHGNARAFDAIDAILDKRGNRK